MTTPDYLHQVRDLRTAIAAGDLTVDTALEQAAADATLGLFAQDLIRTLLTYSDAQFEGFAAPAWNGPGRSTMLTRFVNAAMATEHVHYEVAAPSSEENAPAVKGQFFRIRADGTPVRGIAPIVDPKDLPKYAFGRGGEGKTQTSITIDVPEGALPVDIEQPEERS